MKTRTVNITYELTHNITVDFLTRRLLENEKFKKIVCELIKRFAYKNTSIDFTKEQFFFKRTIMFTYENLQAELKKEEDSFMKYCENFMSEVAKEVKSFQKTVDNREDVVVFKDAKDSKIAFAEYNDEEKELINSIVKDFKKALDANKLHLLGYITIDSDQMGCVQIGNFGLREIMKAFIEKHGNNA